MQWLRHNHAEPDRGSNLPARGIRSIPRVCVRLLAGWLLLLPSPAARAQSDNTVEYPVKLAFLYNITKFVEWPADAFHDPNSPLVICVVGTDPFRAELEQELRRRSAGGRPIDLKRVRPSDDLRDCQIAFVPAAEEKKAVSIAASLKGSSTLTVSETEGFAERGGMINLTVENNNLHFEINLAAARQNRLTISSKVLALARIVNNSSAP